MYSYRLQEKPPEVKHINDYIIKHKVTGEERFLDYYFHCYESDLNKRYSWEEGFEPNYPTELLSRLVINQRDETGEVLGEDE